MHTTLSVFGPCRLERRARYYYLDETLKSFVELLFPLFNRSGRVLTFQWICREPIDGGRTYIIEKLTWVRV